MAQPLAILQAKCFHCFSQKGLHYEIARKVKPSWLSHTACNIIKKLVPLWLTLSKDTDDLNALTSLISKWPPWNTSERLFLEKLCSWAVRLSPLQLSQCKWVVQNIIDTSENLGKVNLCPYSCYIFFKRPCKGVLLESTCINPAPSSDLSYSDMNLNKQIKAHLI